MTYPDLSALADFPGWRAARAAQAAAPAPGAAAMRHAVPGEAELARLGSMPAHRAARRLRRGTAGRAR